MEYDLLNFSLFKLITFPHTKKSHFHSEAFFLLILKIPTFSIRFKLAFMILYINSVNQFKSKKQLNLKLNLLYKKCVIAYLNSLCKMYNMNNEHDIFV